MTFEIIHWRRRKTATARGELTIMTPPITTPKEQSLLEALVRRLGLTIAHVLCIAPSTSLTGQPKAVLVLGDHPHPNGVSCFTLPTLEYLLNNPLEKRQAEITLRQCQAVLSIP